MSSNHSLFAIGILALGVSVPSVTAQSRNGQISGAITKIEPNLIEVRTDNCQTTSILLADSTEFRPWNLQARGLSWPAKVPNWQLVTRADVQSLKVGQRVHVDVTPETRPTARIVWIVGP